MRDIIRDWNMRRAEHSFGTNATRAANTHDNTRETHTRSFNKMKPESV